MVQTNLVGKLHPWYLSSKPSDREALLVRCPEWCLCLSDQAPIRFMTLGGPVSLPGVRKVYTNKASTPLVAEFIAEKHDLSSNHCRGLSYGQINM